MRQFMKEGNIEFDHASAIYCKYDESWNPLQVLSFGGAIIEVKLHRVL